MAPTVFAYDGSTHGDWVGRYAVRLAKGVGDGLEILHVDDAATDKASIDRKLRHLTQIAESADVAVRLRHVPVARAGVGAALDAAIPLGTERLVVTGLRARESGRGLLGGTVSEHLLRTAHHDVLAVRVVAPGLLGHARHVLYALSENPASAARAGFFLRAMAPELTRLSLLTVISPRMGHLARPTPRDLARMRAAGDASLLRAQASLRAGLAPFDVPFDPHVSVSADWPSEVVRHAGRIKAQLVLLGSTERSLPQRFIFGNPLERVLHDTVNDVAIFRRARGAR